MADAPGAAYNGVRELLCPPTNAGNFRREVKRLSALENAKAKLAWQNQSKEPGLESSGLVPPKNPGLQSPDLQSPKEPENPSLLSPGSQSPKERKNSGLLSPGSHSPPKSENPGLESEDLFLKPADRSCKRTNESQ